MGGLVLVGVAVPVGPFAPRDSRLVDRTALDAHGRVLGWRPRPDPTRLVAACGGGRRSPWSRSPGGWSGRDVPCRGRWRTQPSCGSTPSPADARGAALEVDAALLRLVRGLLPVPEVLEVRRADDGGRHPALLVTSFLPGERGDLLLPRLDAAQRAARSGGRSADPGADLGGMPMLRRGPSSTATCAIGRWGAARRAPGVVEPARAAALGWSTTTSSAGCGGRRPTPRRCSTR